jgi:hypothetical protein
VNKGSRVCKTSAQSPKTIESSPRLKAKAPEVRANKEVKA